jgi:DNA sulfur modification protein DndD
MLQKLDDIMRIQSIKIKNYRQYRDVTIDFSKKKKSDLQVFLGKNGIGKTNILNAINWCLYGDEPHLSDDSTSLPILNTIAFQNAKENVPEEVEVQLTVLTEEGNPIIFSRIEPFLVKKNTIQSQKQQFKVITLDKKLNNKILDKEKSERAIENFVPKSIREYFFFDGERLDNYFKVPGENIQKAIKQISKIDILFQMRERIETISKSYKKEAGKVSNEINIFQSQLEENNSSLNLISYQLGETNSQYEISKTEKQKISEDLLKFPKVGELETNKILLDRKIEENSRKLEDKNGKKTSILHKQFVLIATLTALNSTIQMINEKRKKGEIPPFTDKEKLILILKENFCGICGRELDSNSKKRVEEIIENLPFSSKTATTLSNLEQPINMLISRIAENREELIEISQEIEEYKSVIENDDETLNDIKSKLANYDIEKIRDLERKRAAFEEASLAQKERIGHLTERRDKIQEEIKKLNDKIEIEGRKNTKAKIFMQKVEFCDKAKEILTITINQRLNEIREKIQEETNITFFELVWKTGTFNQITIDDNYDVQITSCDTNLPMRGSLSKAENELLALSFTLALHKVSGFDAPILIDTPVARVSDDQRVNFGEVLAKISQDKQIILLFTPAEYSPDIKEVLEPWVSTNFIFEMTSDEKQTLIKVVK